MHSWLIHACVTTDAFLCDSEEPAKQTDSKGVASAQRRGILMQWIRYKAFCAPLDR